MPYAEIPNIQNIPETVERFVPEPVEVFRSHDGPPEGFFVSLDEDISRTVSEVLDTLGVSPDKNLEALCRVVGRVMVKRLVSHRRLKLELGPWGDPVEVIEVDLRPDKQTD